MNKEKRKTGYASIDQPWMDYYNENSSTTINGNYNQTVWKAVEKSLNEHSQIPLIEYFGKKASREEFANYVISWAKTLKMLDVSEGDLVPLYTLASPDSLAIFLAANAIGAVPYFQKLSITKKALEEETDNAKIAIVFDNLWPIVKDVFDQDRFQHVIFLSPTNSMLFQSEQNHAQNDEKNSTSKLPKYLNADQALELSKHYYGKYESDYSPNRIAVITTSSGTTSHNVKGIMDTNEGVLASLDSYISADNGYGEGKRILTCFPPAASTSLNTLQLIPVLTGGTIIFDPRVDVNLWYSQVTEYKPNITVSTGPVWEKFAKDLLEDEKSGKKIDMSWAETFILGGAGTTPDILGFINNVFIDHGAKKGAEVGYGLSEVFGPLTLTKVVAKSPIADDRPTLSTGLPLPGYMVGIFDEDGQELPYGKGYRGELWIKSKANMHGYFGKEELSKEIIVDDWIHSGDLCEIDELGNVYCYGRIKNTIKIDNSNYFLFDIDNDIRERFKLHDSLIERKTLDNGETALNLYFVQEDSRRDSQELIEEIDSYLADKNIQINGYKEFNDSLPIDPSTLKPKNKDTDGFIKYVDGEAYDVSYDEVELDVYKESCAKKQSK